MKISSEKLKTLRTILFSTNISLQKSYAEIRSS